MFWQSSLRLQLRRRAPLTAALQFVVSTNHVNSEIQVIWVDRELHERAMRLLLERADKAWSLCDAVSFVIMNDRQTRDSLTTDHHFDQAGFVRLLDR
jgi:predicted nucleic acid-binding protein